MPRPPILPLLRWPAIYESGKTYEVWTSEAENAEQAIKIEEGRRNLTLDPPVEAFLFALPRPVHVIVFAEAWCGDVVRHVPVLQRMAEAAPNLHVRYLSREQNLDAFARFLTFGGESIPKMVFLSEEFVECGEWGPMPEACRELIARGKACGDLKTARKRVSELYAADPHRRQVVRELLHHVEIAACKRP